MGTKVRSGSRAVEVTSVQERAARAASGFKSLGIGKGDVVAVYLRNDFPFFEASVAAGLCGAYNTPVNWHYTPEEARYIFSNSGAKAIVIHADLYRGIESALPADVPVFVVETPPEICAAYGLDPAQGSLPEGTTEWGAWLEGFDPVAAPPDDRTRAQPRRSNALATRSTARRSFALLRTSSDAR